MTNHAPSTTSLGHRIESRLNASVLVMGVSGCGKSTVAMQLAELINRPFLEADALHPQSNIEKMSAGTPLTDADRKPWLEHVRDECARHCREDRGCVVACSALKREYRHTLAKGLPRLLVVYLHGDFATIHARLSERKGHFMPDSLLRSQFDTLEDPRDETDVITVEIDQALPQIIEKSLLGLDRLI